MIFNLTALASPSLLRLLHPFQIFKCAFSSFSYRYGQYMRILSTVHINIIFFTNSLPIFFINSIDSRIHACRRNDWRFDRGEIAVWTSWQTRHYAIHGVHHQVNIVKLFKYHWNNFIYWISSRFFGSTIGATIGAVVYNKDDWDFYLPINVVFFLNAAFPLFFLM